MICESSLSVERLLIPRKPTSFKVSCILCIFYRGEVLSIAKEAENRFASYRFIDFGDLPWDRIIDQAVKSMLDRYVQEREAGQFGDYVDGFATNSGAGCMIP